MENQGREMVRSNLRTIMLSMLNESKEGLHGYAIIATMRKEYGVYLGPSTVYPLLGLFERDGFAEAKWDVEKSEKPRKLYFITPKGVSALRDAALHFRVLYTELSKNLNT